MSEIEWSKKQKDAQLLLAIGNLDKQEIADNVGISRTTLWTWEKKPEFKAEVDRIKQDTENFALRLYYNNLIKAVNNVQHLGDSANNEMVKLNANLETIYRILGKPSNNVTLTTQVENTKPIDEDILESEFAEIDNEQNGNE